MRKPCKDFKATVYILFLSIIFITSAYSKEQRWENKTYRDSLWNTRGCLTDARGEWFRNAKFGAFIHFGIYSQLGGYWQDKGPYDPAEQIMGLGERKQVIPFEQYRKEVGGAFNPLKFDAKKWVNQIKKAGHKYLIVTTKHHDGFCMFKTATTDFNVVKSTPFGRDVIKELSEECLKQGIVFCPYFSIGDWCAADVMKPEFKSYKEYMFAQIKELLSNYKGIKMIWFDNYWYVGGQWKNDIEHSKELYAYIRTIRPDVLVNDRCGVGAASEDGDYATPENQLKGSLQKRYFEVVMTNTDDDNWGWVKTAANYRSCSKLITNLIDCTSKGGNFVLNVGPKADGKFPEQHMAILDTIGRWTKVNGEAIYKAHPATECIVAENAGLKCYSTKKGNNIYLNVINWQQDGNGATVTIKKKGFAKAVFLDRALPGLQYSAKKENDSVTLKIKKPVHTDPYATVIKLVFSKKPAK